MKLSQWLCVYKKKNNNLLDIDDRGWAKFTHEAKHLMLSLLMCHPVYNYISEWWSRDHNLSSSFSLTDTK